MKKKRILCSMALLFAVILGTPTIASGDVYISGVSGEWGNVVGGKNLLGEGTNTLSWGGWGGQPTGNRSAYQFKSMAPTYEVYSGEVFKLGKFIHYNNPIPGESKKFNNGIKAASLFTSVELDIDGYLKTVDFTHNFLHWETKNLFDGCCDDFAYLVNNMPAMSESFIYGNTEYTLTVGFGNKHGLIDLVRTPEGEKNMAKLFGQITSHSVEVPEPSTYIMLASTLALAMWVSSRRRKTRVVKK